MDKLTLAEIFISTALFLLIWFVQILHYPMFHFIDEKKFAESMAFHQKFISYLTIPLMIAELILSLYSTYLNNKWSYYILGIVISTWVSTFLIQVPLHKKLLYQKDLVLINKLIKTNWARTYLWTIKIFIVISQATI